MNEHMITAWNSVVQPVDTVIHVGDFGFGDESLLNRIFLRLNGRQKHLIRGNHDGHRKRCLALGWTSVVSEMRHQTSFGHNVLLRHRPWEDDNPPPRAEVVVHGHIHNRPTRRAHININVSCEVLNYLPVELDNLVQKHMRVWGWDSA